MLSSANFALCGYQGLTQLFIGATSPMIGLRLDPANMPKKTTHHGQLVMFPSSGAVASFGEIEWTPSRERDSPLIASVTKGPSVSDRVPVVLSGSYRKDFEGLRQTYEELQDIGCDVLSPSNVVAVNEVDGFVYMKGEETQAPESIELRHLRAIERSRFVWLHAPNGYVGPTAALEIGFAKAAGIPVYSKIPPADQILRGFVKVIQSPATLIANGAPNIDPPKPALKAFQEYYKRAAVQRGYSRESARDCLLLMVEEVGELARAIRKRERLTRHSGEFGTEAHELADVFLYVIHLANVLNLDLAEAVRDKEVVNLARFLSTQ